ncbi:MAG: transposase, partial [Ignavibacteria bacterium]|nr:transposase [Ignavibacteria bacterium]
MIEINHQFTDYKQKARANHTSDEGIRQRILQAYNVETIFGNIKQNGGFTGTGRQKLVCLLATSICSWPNTFKKLN